LKIAFLRCAASRQHDPVGINAILFKQRHQSRRATPTVYIGINGTIINGTYAFGVKASQYLQVDDGAKVVVKQSPELQVRPERMQLMDAVLRGVRSHVSAESETARVPQHRCTRLQCISLLSATTDTGSLFSLQALSGGSMQAQTLLTPGQGPHQQQASGPSPGGQ